MGAIERFLDLVRTIDDPRIERCKLHPLPEIFLATLAGVISNAAGWQDIEDFAAAKLEVLREYLPYGNGVPSDDTLRRLFPAMTRCAGCSVRSIRNDSRNALWPGSGHCAHCRKQA